MRSSTFITFFFIATLYSLGGFSQTFRQDSIRTSEIATEFFEWYISAAKSHQTNEFNPVEIQNEYGMTTLDFSTYFKNLREHSFSDALIEEEENTYNSCIQKLSKVKYADYLKLTDLDQFESLDDAFTNYYRWTGGQEMYSFYKVVEIKINNDKAIVVGSLFFDNSGSEKRDFDRQITVALIKLGGNWKIREINY
jgi:hypothetical protein